jgi:S1-C subfamily serine protease
MNIEDSGSNAVRVPLAAERLKRNERSEQTAQITGKAGDQSHPLRHSLSALPAQRGAQTMNIEDSGSNAVRVPLAAERLRRNERSEQTAQITGKAGDQSHPLRHSLMMLVACLVLLASTSCTRHHLSDTPAARRELARSVIGYEDQKIAGKSWVDYAASRTAYLIPGDDVQSPERGVFVLDPLRGAGRGAALTRDGYYLTANHVVDATDTPGLLDFSRAPGVHRGRVVKRFEEADLALVKFDFRPRAWLSDWQEGPIKGEHVFAAAATDQWQKEPLSGNGGFQASGDAIEVLPIRGGEAYGAKAAKTTLPARGGMSGAPLVDAKGRLVGIMLESRDAPLRPPGFKISVSGMISPAVLEKLVKEDRRGKR